MTTIEQRIKFLLDKSSQQQTRKSLQELSRDLQKAGDKARKAFLAGKLEADEFNKELERVEKETDAVNRALDRLEKPRKIQVSATDLNNDRFSRVSNDVSSFGDADSAFAAIGGTSDFFGASGAGQGAQAAAELLATAEALPRLKTSIQGIPASAQAAAKEIGAAGFGLIGALVVLTAVTKAAQSAQEERTNIARGRIDALLNVNDLERASNAELIAIRNDLTEQLKNDEEDLATARRVASGIIEGANNQFGVLGRVIVEAGNATGVAATELGEARKTIDDLSGTTIEAQDNLETVNRLLEERNVIDEQTVQNLLDSASLAGELATAQAQADELGIDALNDQIDALQDRKTALDAELQVLKASGDTSEEVTDRIAALTQQIANLGQQAAIFEAERPEAQARTDAIEAEKQAVKDAAEAERERAQSARQAEQTVKQLANAERTRSDAAADLAQKEADGREDLAISLADDLAKIARDAQREVRDVLRESSRDVRDSIASGDILGLQQIAQAREDALADVRISLRDENQDRAIAERQKQRDLSRNLQREERSINLSYQRRIRDLNQNLSTFERTLSQGIKRAFDNAVGNTVNGEASPTPRGLPQGTTASAGSRFIGRVR